MSNVIPDFSWYSAGSTRLGLKSPRCPFASVHACPRYYQSLSLLGGAGCASIPRTEDDALKTKWEQHPLWPTTAEQSTGIGAYNGKPKDFRNFCPEVAYDQFGLFATFLNDYVDEDARDSLARRLTEIGASQDDPRWRWASIRPQHYAECPLHSALSHDWVKHVTRPIVTSAPAPATPSVPFDVFISHASEDKDDFVRPLAATLTAMGLKVWYDEWTLKLGDSLRKEIDKGLANSQFGVVVLSRDFFAKNWTQSELDGLFALEMQGRKVILPIWHNVTRADVLQYSPMLAGKLAAPTNEGVALVAAKVFAAVRPNTQPIPPSVVVGTSHAKSTAHKGGKFAIELGKRHRHLREKILKINPRRMADFYGFEKVAQLEACERGEDEFPTAGIKKLRQCFFVSRGYLEDGASEVFDSFEITCSSEECATILSQGFEPFLFCLNELRDQMMCYPVLHKEEDGLDRVIAANSGGYFASGGGGKSNIMHFIEAIHKKGITPYSVPVQKIDRKTWDALEAKTFYFTGDGRFLGPDGDGQDCFLAWWKEFEEEQARIKNQKRTN